MNYSESLLKQCSQDSFNQEVLETYKRSDESARMDMYMTYRELRERFERIEASPAEISWS
jgi:hypothetical protein